MDGEFVVEGDEQQPEGQGRDAGDTGRQPDRQGWIPPHRFKEVTAKLKELQAQVETYRRYGTPEELANLQQRMAELSKGTTFTPSEKEKLRKELLEVVPELQHIGRYIETRGQTYVNEGARKVDRYLQEIGVEVNENTNLWLQELLSGVIARDKKLLARFAADDPGVFDEAWRQTKKVFWGGRKPPGAEVQRLKQPPKALPTAPAVPAEPTKPKSERDLLDDASEKAFALLNQED